LYLHDYQQLKHQQPEAWGKIKESCSNHVHTQNNWQPVFDSVLGNECQFPRATNKVYSKLNSLEEAANWAALKKQENALSNLPFKTKIKDDNNQIF